MFGLVKESRLKECQKELLELQRRIIWCEKVEKDSIENQIKINGLQSEITTLKQQIREQTEADLFFISAKIQKKLLDGEPKENVRELNLQQIAYQQQMSAFQQASTQSSFLQGLGLGSLPFGR